MISFRAPVYTHMSGMLGRSLAGGVLLLLCLSSIPLLAQHIFNLPLLNEIGYGDSYILHDALHFQRTGVIYRDLSGEPYMPAQYSPLLYIAFSGPGRILSSENPFLGPRLVVLAAFVLCIAVVASITRTLIPVRRAWVWAPLLAGTISCMWPWVLQIRADFPGIFFSLLAIRLLLSPAGWAVPLAGAFAGLATQFKITFVAAHLAGGLWLLGQRRWRDLTRFAIVGITVSAGFYLLYAIREPRMLSQIVAASPGIVDVSGALRLIHRALTEPVVLLSLLGLSCSKFDGWPRWTLITLFAITSFAFAWLADLQAGGNINYFFEGLFALIPLAVLGVLRLIVLAGQRITVGLFAAGLFAFQFLAPMTQQVRSQFRNPGVAVQSKNDEFRKVERVLSGQHLFSTVPRLALIDPTPALMEPYLMSYLHRLGKFDLEPILKRVRQAEFDVVITFVARRRWRGVDGLGPELQAAILSAYRPQCVILDSLVYLRRDPSQVGSALAQDLANIGCVSPPPVE